MEFSYYDAYQNALSAKQITIPGIGTVTVEERRKNDEPRHHHRNRQSYDNYQRYNQPHNGMNSQRGGRGGDRRSMSTRAPTKSPS